MYAHIGGDKAVDAGDILFILPKKTLLASYDTRRTMAELIGGGRVTELPGGSTDCYVICTGEGAAVYACPVASRVLGERVNRNEP